MTLNNINNSRGHNIKYLPSVLTEQGIMMLSGLLKSDIAVKVNIENMIYKIRGVEVMQDSDLAKLYHCTNGTKNINKAVKRN